MHVKSLVCKKGFKVVCIVVLLLLHDLSYTLQGFLASGRSPFLKIQSGDSSKGGEVIIGYLFDFSYGRSCRLSHFVYKGVSALSSGVSWFPAFEA